MNNELKEAINSIAVTDEQKARMLSGIKRRAAQNRSRTKWLRVTAAVAALCCLFGMTAFAEEISGFIAGIFTSDAVVGDAVRTNVYYDTDGHVEMTVEEVLSDVSTVRMVIRYDALDAQGREWLSGRSFLGDDPEWYDENDRYGMELDGIIANDYGYSGASFDAYELQQYRTESERRLVVFMEACNDLWGTEAKLTYDMPDGKREVTIDVSTNIEKRIYTLDSPQETDRLYRPTFVKLSPLTIVVCGENLGAFYYREYETQFGTFSKIGSYHDDVTVESMKILFDDGSEIVMFAGGCGLQNMSLFGILPETEDPDDCIIATMSFDRPIDPDTVSGIEIDGIFYPFK